MRVQDRRPAVAVAEALESRQLMSVVLGLQASNTLIAVDSATPATTLATLKVKGLERRENLLGIDFRPATGLLYGMGSSNRLYTIDVLSGQATAVGTTTFAVPLNGTEFGFDFNPVADRIRVVSDADQNLRLDPDTGAVVDSDTVAADIQADASLAYDPADGNAGQDPAVIGVAYTNSDTDAATATTLVGIDADRNVLVRQGSPDGAPVSPNAGTLFSVGPLGVDVEPVGGLDILTSGTTNTAFAALTTNLRRASELYTIDLDTGAAAPVGQIGRGRRPTLDIAAAPAGTPFFVVTAKSELLGLNTAAPNLVLSRGRITGLGSRRERVVGIDFRPATGQLWALTDADQLYTLDTGTAVATAVGSASEVDLTAKTPFGFDFNPAVDRIRVTTAAGQNLRFDPATGAAVDFDPADPDIDPDTPLTYIAGDANAAATPRIVGSAYGNNIAAVTPTTLYGIDSTLDVLATQGSVTGTPTSPNTGQLITVGPTVVDVPDELGFDIVTRGGIDTALAVFAPRGSKVTGVYSVNVATGVITLVSDLNKKVRNAVGMAILTGP